MVASRPIIAVAACAAILGLVKSYTSFVANMPKQQTAVIQLEEAAGVYALEVTLTFRAESDAFDVVDPYAIKVTLDGVADPIVLREDPVDAGVPIRIEPIEGLKIGENEFFVDVKVAESEDDGGFADSSNDGFGTNSENLDDGFTTVDGFDEIDEAGTVGNDSGDQSSDGLLSRAMRLRILRGENVISENTLWSEPGHAIGGKIIVVINEEAMVDEDETHSHIGHED